METASRRSTSAIRRPQSNVSVNNQTCTQSCSLVDKVYSLLRGKEHGKADFALIGIGSQLRTGYERDEIINLRFFCASSGGVGNELYDFMNEHGCPRIDQKAAILLKSGRFEEVLSLFQASSGDEKKALVPFRIASLFLTGRVDEAQAWLDCSEIPIQVGDVLDTNLLYERGEISRALELAVTYNRWLCLYNTGQNRVLEEEIASGDYPVEEDQAVNNLKSLLGIIYKEEQDDPIAEFNNQLRKLEGTELIEYLEGFLFRSDVVPLRERTLGFYAAANMLVESVKLEDFSRAADLLASTNEVGIERCFADPEDFKFLKILVNVKSQVLKDETVLTLKRTIDARLLSIKRISDPCAIKQLRTDCCLLGQALWDENLFDETENLLLRCQQYCSEFTEWKINCANVLLVKERFHEASTLYEDIISASFSKLLALPAAVLANQCVSLIMCDRNNEAEGLLESVLEAEDEQQDNEQCQHHSTVINLVIGHLYCSKKNFGFGMDRIFAALSDLSKVQSETWYYFKTSFMSMLACMVSDEATEFVPDCLIGETVKFLDKVCTIDRKLKAHTGASIRNEALYMRDLFNQAVY